MTSFGKFAKFASIYLPADSDVDSDVASDVESDVEIKQNKAIKSAKFAGSAGSAGSAVSAKSAGFAKSAKTAESGKSEKVLPIQKYLPEILNAFLKHKVIELFAPTGTGKSTGFAKEFVKHNYREILGGTCMMSIPTVVGVNTLFHHVEQELGEKASKFACGAGGYYTPNFDTADLCVCTTQIVINCLLRLYSEKNKMDDLIVVIDEAHHTSSENYILIYLCDWLIEHGYKLRCLIMTATPSNYDLKHLVATKTFSISKDEVEHHDITEHWSHHDVFSISDIKKFSKPFNELFSEIEGIINIATTQCKGNGLIFVPGEGEAEDLANFCRNRFNNIRFETLYSSLNSDEIKEVIRHDPRIRKIIIATNIAECSVTFDIDFVIDTLCHKEMIMRNRNGRVYGELGLQIISNAARMQRRGRCGRIRHGHYFPLCTQSFAKQMTPHTISSFVNGDKALHVLSLLRSKMPAFDILRMDPIDIENVKARLTKFGLYDEKTNSCTKLGTEITHFQLPLELAVFLLCLRDEAPEIILEACILISIIATKDSIQSPFYFPRNVKGAAKNDFIMDNFGDYFYSDDLTGILKLVCEVADATNMCTYNTGKYMRERHLNEKFFRQVIRVLNQTLPRFSKAPVSSDIFKSISNNIDTGNFDLTDFTRIAKRFFPVYNHSGKGRYVSIDFTQNQTSYTIDNCRLSTSQPSQIVAFSEIAIVVPNKKGGGTCTLHLLSLCISTL